MIFVDNLGGWFPPINHSDWNYVTLADFVMPFFLFMVSDSACKSDMHPCRLATGTQTISSPTLALLFADDIAVQVGCSMSLSFKKYKKGVFWKVVKRTAKLFVIGECIGHMQATTLHRTTGCRTLSVVEHHSQPSHAPLHCCPCN